MFKVFFYYIIVRKSNKTTKSKVFTKWDQDDEMYIMRCMSEPEAQRYLKKVLNKKSEIAKKEANARVNIL